MSEQAIIDQLVVITGALADLHLAVGQLHQEQAEANRRLEQIAAVVGMIYLSTNDKTAIPAEVWNDPVFERFLDMYPIDGPPIIGARAMQQVLEQMDKQAPAQLAAALTSLEHNDAPSGVEQVRNAQLARQMRERVGDLDWTRSGERSKDR